MNTIVHWTIWITADYFAIGFLVLAIHALWTSKNDPERMKKFTADYLDKFLYALLVMAMWLPLTVSWLRTFLVGEGDKGFKYYDFEDFEDYSEYDEFDEHEDLRE